MRRRLKSVVIGFEPRDIWVGVYWDRKLRAKYSADDFEMIEYLYVYICIIPCIPIVLEYV